MECTNDFFKNTMNRKNNGKPGKRQRWRNSSISLITNNASEKLVCPRLDFSSRNDLSTECKQPEYPEGRSGGCFRFDGFAL